MTNPIYRYAIPHAKASLWLAFISLIFACVLWPILYLVSASALIGAVTTGYFFKHHLALLSVAENREAPRKREPITIEGEYRVLKVES